jgi:hypothetical protein
VSLDALGAAGLRFGLGPQQAQDRASSGPGWPASFIHAPSRAETKDQ